LLTVITQIDRKQRAFDVQAACHYCGVAGKFYAFDQRFFGGPWKCPWFRRNDDVVSK